MGWKYRPEGREFSDAELTATPELRALSLQELFALVSAGLYAPGIATDEELAELDRIQDAIQSHPDYVE